MQTLPLNHYIFFNINNVKVLMYWNHVQRTGIREFSLQINLGAPELTEFRTGLIAELGHASPILQKSLQGAFCIIIWTMKIKANYMQDMNIADLLVKQREKWNWKNRTKFRKTKTTLQWAKCELHYYFRSIVNRPYIKRNIKTIK